MLRRHEIKDQEWERIQGILPPENTGEGRPSKPNRAMLNDMLWKVQTGVPWRDLPERFGPWKTVYSRFRLWSKDALFQQILSPWPAMRTCRKYPLTAPPAKFISMRRGLKRG
jgi:transposase